MSYSDFFESVTGRSPFPYQVRFANDLVAGKPPDIISVPTGCGKTNTILCGFLYHLTVSPRFRRLVFSLPMRSLSSQVAETAERLVAASKLDVGVHLMMGGAVNRDWVQTPDRPVILVGTQDQVLSRAINRGYGMTPFQWAMDFGLINSDALFVFDETQMMGVGAQTSVALQRLRDQLGCVGSTHTIWMSATNAAMETSLERIDA